MARAWYPFRLLARFKQKIGNQFVETPAVLYLGPVAAVAEDVQLRVFDAPEQVFGTGYRDDAVIPAVDNQVSCRMLPTSASLLHIFLMPSCRGAGNMAA